MKGNIIEQIEEEVPEDDPTDDPALVEAVNFARKLLYQDGLAAKVSSIVKKHPDPGSQIATLSYDLTAKADEATGGNVQDDNLISLGAFIMSEISEIAESSGAEFKPTDMASALKQMIVRYLDESGVDSSAIQEAMGGVSAKQFTALHDKVIGMEESA